MPSNCKPSRCLVQNQLFERPSNRIVFRGALLAISCLALLLGPAKLSRAEQKVMLIETFATRFPGRPIVTGSGMAGYGPANTVLTQEVADNLYLCGDGNTAAAPGTGLMAPRVGVAAHHQANAVLRLLLGQNPVIEKE